MYEYETAFNEQQRYCIKMRKNNKKYKVIWPKNHGWRLSFEWNCDLFCVVDLVNNPSNWMCTFLQLVDVVNATHFLHQTNATSLFLWAVFMTRGNKNNQNIRKSDRNKNPNTKAEHKTEIKVKSKSLEKLCAEQESKKCDFAILKAFFHVEAIECRLFAFQTSISLECQECKTICEKFP